MRREYWYLIMAIVISGGLFWYFLPDRTQFVSALMGNIAAGFIGSLATAFIVDRVIEARQRKERDRIRGLAFTELTPTIVGHVRFIASCYKASSERPTAPPLTLSDLLTRDALCSLRCLDFSKTAPVFPERDWFRHSADEARELIDGVEKIIDHYGSAMDSDALVALSELKNSLLARMLVWMANTVYDDSTMSVIRTYNILWDDSMIALVYEHSRLVWRVALLISTVKEPDWRLARIWMDDMSPAWASARQTTYSGPPVSAGPSGPPTHTACSGDIVHRFR